MPISVRTFRRLILATWGLAILAGIAYVLTIRLLPEPLRSFEQARLTGEMDTSESIAGILALILIALSIWNTVELYRLRPRARSWYVRILLVSLALVPMGGPYVDSGWGQLFYYAAALLGGMILGALFWSDIAQHFQRQPRAESPPGQAA
jgi:hypothetical protein